MFHRHAAKRRLRMFHGTALTQHCQGIHRLIGRDAIIFKRDRLSHPVWQGRVMVPGERRRVVPVQVRAAPSPS